MDDITLKFDCEGIDWLRIHTVIYKAGLTAYPPELIKKAFEGSRAVIFIFNDSGVIATGRALSDGAYQSVIYDVAVLPEWQGRGIGRQIMESLLERISGQNIMLYASPGKEGFYERFGFRRLRTGMALFKKPREMQKKGLTD